MKKTSSPHIRTRNGTSRIMRDVLIALIPAVFAGTLIFGLRALVIVLLCTVSSVAAEFFWKFLSHQHMALSDCSAAVTGMLLAMTLPASVPYGIAVLGSAFAVIFVKEICGGLGQNIFNPALAARAFLLLCFPRALTQYPAAGSSYPLSKMSDIVSSATPLHEMQQRILPEASLWDMLIGNIGGCIGEVCSLALLAGGIYLLARKVLSPRIPLACLGTVALLTLVFSKSGYPLEWMLYQLLGGGLILGAFFMATDYASSPVTPRGRLIHGAGCGALTVLFRYTGIFPEGFTYAVLLMNAASPLIDQLTAPRRFGIRKGATE